MVRLLYIYSVGESIASTKTLVDLVEQTGTEIVSYIYIVSNLGCIVWTSKNSGYILSKTKVDLIGNILTYIFV